MQTKVSRRIISRGPAFSGSIERAGLLKQVSAMAAIGLWLAGPNPAAAGGFSHPVDPHCKVHLVDQPRTLITNPPADPWLAVSLPGVIGTAAADTGQAVIPHHRLSITNLQDGQTVWNDARELPLDLSIQPPLAPNHHIRVYLDGRLRGGAFRQTQIVLHGINRGPHRLQVRLVDGADRVLAQTPSITIYHHQHSVATPP
jgi:hypothetical protein